MLKPELLSPARDFEQLDMSLCYGADAVYFGGTNFSLRASCGNFDSEEMRSAITLCHSKGVKAYVACNAVMNNNDLRELPGFFEKIADAGADAVIVSDLGAMAVAKKHAPSVNVHISTQAGVFNHETARVFYDLGASRVILARELTLAEISEIFAKKPPGLELETFVHGSMCVAISGRCLLSHYFSGRDANKGDCAQPCRWKYSLVEETRRDELWEIYEDGAMTHIMNSRDLCMIDHVDDLLKSGVVSLKIEGRMKSSYYAAVVTNAYRKAIDAALADVPLSKIWQQEVYKVSHREYSTGFYREPAGPGQQLSGGIYTSQCAVAAFVESCDDDGEAVLSQRNKFGIGDTLELLTPDDEPVKFTVTDLRDDSGKEIESAPHPMMRIRTKLPIQAPRLSIVRKYYDK